MIRVNDRHIWDYINNNPHIWGVSERGAARTLNQWLKRTIEKKRNSHPMACCFGLSLWMMAKASTLDELLRCCQRFGVQWIRVRLACATLSIYFSITSSAAPGLPSVAPDAIPWLKLEQVHTQDDPTGGDRL